MKLARQLFAGLVLISTASYAQNNEGVGIGINSVPVNAILNIHSTDNRGVLFPRFSSNFTVNTTENPHLGLLYYNTTNKAYYRWDGSWARLVNTGSVADVSSVSSSGAITASTGDITATAGDVIAGATLRGANAIVTSNISTTTLSTSSTISATGNVSTSGEFIGNGTIPKGGIIMWSGTTVPSGWALCNGSNNTPNLTDRFIMASPTPGAGDVRVMLDNLSTDYRSGSTDCSIYSKMYTGSGTYYNSAVDREYPFFFSDVPATDWPAAAQAEIGTGNSIVQIDTPEEDREEDNPNYYVGNPNCHQGARYYKLAFIMRKN
ncbi:phage tail protein [Marinoscillum pacificum]|uniref:phage tail protein n=1 Tax=Marinoscillum pacificum TaxID=392723 RepID=UPI002157DD03|nr:phage tail protein [Marinoscillum pacificum]